ncbi:putative PEP-CTERM protein-sorting domain-containing protein [Candidatus Methylobacter favarea]|uniref:Putative PEP-CTERM protein-sorting domain-containing protein n=2 Tax=Candidatus Methylobacter favarea TaxID=2707345 RepID=A0A8S0WSC8_9GAMM|nr:putative PEP-CTERM protein-sorting domain-containing protein [Candidatus Methylobacter favarea]
MNIMIKKEKTPFRLAFLLAVTGLLTLGSAFTTNAYAASCGTSGGLDTINVTFRDSDSDGCGGVFSGNDSLTAVNDSANNLLFGGTNWLYELKDDSPGAPGSGSASFLGLDWTLSAGSTGSWTLTIADPNPASLPVATDFLAVLKGSNSWAAYFFDNEVFNSTGTSAGTFNIVFANGGSNDPDLSHLTLYARQGDLPPTNPDTVPEPSIIWLIGIGLMSLTMVLSKQSKSALQA